MHLFLNKLASMEKELSEIFIYYVQSWRKSGVIFAFNLGRFPFVIDATIFFIHSLNSFVFKNKCFCVAGFLQSVPYVQISDMIAGVDIIGGKVSVVSVIGAEGYGDVLTQQRGF